MTWSNPCSTVSGYKLFRDNTPINTFKVNYPGQTFAYYDNNIQWETTYNYELIAVYPILGESTPAPYSILTGYEECEGKNNEFCDNNIRKRCNEFNQVSVPLTNTQLINCQQNGLICTGPDETGLTYCKSGKACSSEFNPFGLYANLNDCYGNILDSQYQNNCYFDYSSTIVNTCNSCSELNSCFDYNCSLYFKFVYISKANLYLLSISYYLKNGN